MEPATFEAIMNEKLKGIMHSAWNEPRHFFSWLALLSLCAFGAALLGAALGGPTKFFALAMVGSGLCFIVGTLAFVLAWIPPVRRLFVWLLGRRFLVLGCLVTLVALFYAVEDWRGHRAWQAYKTDREAKGERFDLTHLAPPAVPADQNFFETPLWQDMHFTQTNGVRIWSDTNWSNRVWFDVYSPESSKAPATGNWMAGRRMDLAAWQGYYRGESNKVREAQGPAAETPEAQAFRRRYGLERETQPSPSTNYFAVAKEPQTPAADVLLALSKYDGNRRLLIEAAARPRARFWVNYGAGAGMLLAHLGRVKGSVRYLSFHAIAELKSGQKETAFQDVKLMFRLSESIRAEPILISQLVRSAVLQLALQPIWEGLAGRQWSEADLDAIEGELGKVDLLADYQLALRGERACNLWAVDYMRRVGIQALDELTGTGIDGGIQERTTGFLDGEKLLGRGVFALMPAGWFDQNKLVSCRMYERYMLPLVDQERRLILPTKVQQAGSMHSELARSPYRFLAGILLPAVGRAAERFAYTQASVDLARVACGLERYRQASGQFPGTLDALVPKFIGKLPHDVVNGQPLQYRRTDDGQFVLYSVGLNEADDGGKVELAESGNADIRKGDWVWRYPTK
jgi:hypothetical protein